MSASGDTNLMLFPRVAANVRWFLGPGQSLTGHSPAGAMFDRAELYDNHVQFRTQRIEHGLMRQEQVRAGETPMSFRGQPEYTAVPTAEVRPAPSHDTNDESIRRFAKVSTGFVRLGRVRDDGPAVLRARYGSGSEEWELKGFTLGGIYRLVDSGRDLMRNVIEGNAKRGAVLNLSQPELLSNDFKRAVHHDDTERLCEFGQAKGDATRLLAEVVGVWNQLHAEAD